jgi:hypothetical protein
MNQSRGDRDQLRANNPKGMLVRWFRHHQNNSSDQALKKGINSTASRTGRRASSQQCESVGAVPVSAYASTWCWRTCASDTKVGFPKYRLSISATDAWTGAKQVQQGH